MAVSQGTNTILIDGGTGMDTFIINRNGNPFLLQGGNPIFA